MDAPAAPETLRCDQPARFQVGAVDAIAAVATPEGFAMLAAAGGSVNGWAYELVDGQLIATAQAVPITTSEAGAIGAATDGTTVMVTAIQGMPATGSALVPVDQQLASLGPPTMEVDLAVANPIASGASGFAFATMNAATSGVDARLMAAFGVIVGAPVQIIDASEVPGYVSIIPNANGYAVTYTSAATNPNVDRIELLDANLTVVAGPVTTSNSTNDAEAAHVAWAASSNAYLVAWDEKTSTDGDEVWIQMLGPNLEPVTQPRKIADHCYSPTVASDDTGFWLTWASYVNSPAPDFLDAAHVALDGTITPRAVTSSGGSPGQWTMVERLGQPVLVWAETGGSGPDLYLDPMCN